MSRSYHPNITERSIVNTILKYLNSLPECYAIKTHGGQYRGGQPDIMGSFQGRFLALEVKRPGGKPTKLQMEILKKWAAAGAIAGVVYSVDEVQKLIREAVSNGSST
ncbi:VRR-NUC domain-containing protein [Desulforamulus ruminis]|uniref:VRR-NUC domain-containing protein n=1 Tax=Desulforamulus ruminis TaxID=1564 RepID=UPI0023577ED9|nr:VRR-NUC domain-containing protein [Desulforamulus ruminis]